MKNESGVFSIRVEKAEDYPKINELLLDAFSGRTDLVPFVKAIRESKNYVPEYSLVAEINGRIIGHVMLSYIGIVDEDKNHKVLSLSPLSVASDMQRQGVGGKLINGVVSLADEDGEPLIILEGSPNYYPKFGFVPVRRHNITMDLPDWASPDAGMVKTLSNDDVSIKGHVVYPPAFHIVGD